MPSLKDFARKIDTRTVVIRGRTYSVRKLSIAEQDAIRSAVELPEPPVGFDRTKGTAAGPTLLYDAPAYRLAVASRERRISLVEACASLGLDVGTDGTPVRVPPNVTPAAWKEYADACWNMVAVQGGLDDDEINAVHEALAAAPKDPVKEAEGN